MSPEAQRIAIGMALGARWFQSPDGNLYFKFPTGTQGWVQCVGPLPDCSNPTWICVPSYCTDLNAMHEAEEVLTEKQVRSYAFKLAQVLDTSPTVDLDDQFLNIHATAAQRAEAFLRTLNLWENNT